MVYFHSVKSSGAFINAGFQNWKKALKKFNSHEASHTHRESKLKWVSRDLPAVAIN